jgi:hypothetical protein
LAAGAKGVLVQRREQNATRRKRGQTWATRGNGVVVPHGFLPVWVARHHEGQQLIDQPPVSLPAPRLGLSRPVAVFGAKVGPADAGTVGGKGGTFELMDFFLHRVYLVSVS